MNSFYGQNQIFKLNAGSNRQGLNYRQIKEIKIILPRDIEEFERFGKILTQINDQLNEVDLSYSKLNLVRKGLLCDLISAKVRVPDELLKNIVEQVLVN